MTGWSFTENQVRVLLPASPSGLAKCVIAMMQR